MLTNRLLKKTHILRCARSARYNALAQYASARRFFPRLGSELFLSSLHPLSSLQSTIFLNLLIRRINPLERSSFNVFYFSMLRSSDSLAMKT